MLTTPIGMRTIELSEKTAFLYAAKNFSQFIFDNALAEEVGKQDSIRIAMSGDGPFVKLPHKSQLIALCETVSQITDPYSEFEITQIKNSAMECVYAWMLYEIKLENERFTKSEGISGREVCNFAYMAWQEQMANFQFNMRSVNLAEWEKLVDSLATRLVFDNKQVKVFKMGEIISVESFNSAAKYFQML